MFQVMRDKNQMIKADSVLAMTTVTDEIQVKSIRTVLARITVASMKHHDHNQVGEEKGLLHSQFHSSKEARAGTQEWQEHRARS